MPLLRRLYKIVAIVVWTPVVAIMMVPYRFISGWESTIRISHLVRLWARGMAKIFNLRIKIYGNIPEASGGLFVSNHLGYLDILAHGTILPMRFTSTVVINKWPVIGWVTGLSRPILVDRNSAQSSRKASRDFVKTMKRGMYLIVYPEGTSTDGKGGILPFKSTSFDAAVMGDMPILPILTRYREVPGRETVCWYGDMTLMPHLLRILGYPRIDAELHFLDPIMPEGRSRKDLARDVREVMLKEYEKLPPME